MSEDMMSVVEAAVAEHTGAEGSGDESTSGEAPASETTDSAAEGAEGAEAAAASTEPGVDAPEAAAKEAEAKPSDDDELKSLEQELVEKTPALKNGKIPVSRHQAVLTRERRKFEAQVKELESKYKPYEDPAFRNRVQAMEIAERDPDRFLQFLTSLPHYRERIDKLVEQRALQVAPAPPPAAVDDEKKPEPDRIEPDGSLGYSPEQAEKLAQYYARQAERKAQERIEKLQAEVKPLVERHKVAALVKEAEIRQGQILNHARKYWEGFQEFEPEIKAYIDAQPPNVYVPLQDAYDAVVRPKLVARAQEREAQQKKLIEEERAKAVREYIEQLNAKSSQNTTIVPGRLPAASATPAGEQSMEDIVRAAIRSAA